MATLTQVNPISGAKEDVPYNITFGILKTYANESANTLSFRLMSVDTSKGTLLLTKSGNTDIPVNSDYLTNTKIYISSAGVAIVNGSTTTTGYALTWKTPPDQSGTFSGAFTVQASENATADSNLSGTNVAITLNAIAVNDAPTLTSFTTLTGAVQNTPFEITYASLTANANEADVEGDPIYFSIQSITSGTTLNKWNGSAWQAVTAGTLIGLDEKLQWTPTTAGSQQAAFTIKAYDGQALSADPSVSVTIDVAAANNPPSFTNTSSTTVNDNVDATPFSNITLTDDSSSLTLTVTPDSLAKGVFTSASLTTSGFTYSNDVYTLSSKTPDQAQTALKALVYNPTDNRVPVDQTETTTFTVTLDDGKNVVTNTATTVTATSVNVAPTLSVGSSLTAIEDTSYTFTQSIFTSRFTDADGDSLNKIKITTLPDSNRGTLKLAGTAISTTTEIPATQLATLAFVPAANYNGTASFQWQAYDGTVWSGSASLAMTIAPVPDITVISAPASKTYIEANTLIFGVTFDEPVTVTGTPRIALNIGGITKYANYAASTSGNTLNFSYTLESGLTDSDGIGTGGVIDLNGGAIKNSNNQAAASLAFTQDTSGILVDSTPPGLTLHASRTQFKAGETAAITFSFTEDPGSTFTWNGTSGDITVTGGTLGTLSGTGTTRTATFTPTANTNNLTGSLSVAAATYTDAAGNNGTVSNTISVSGDTQPPSLTLTSNKTSFKAGETATLTFTFSEVPTGFDSSDITVTGGTLGSISGTGTTIQTATFTPTANTNNLTGNISVAAATYTDAAGNNGTVSNTISVSGDTQAPTLTLSSNKTSFKAGETATLTFTFSEIPTGFDSNDITVTGGTLGTLGGTGTTRTATFTPTPDTNSLSGNISVAAAIYTDVAGNTGSIINTAANPSALTITGDTLRPTLTLISDKISYKFTETAILTFTFSEAPTGFTVNDIIPVSGTISGFSGSGTTYTAGFTALNPTNQDTLTAGFTVAGNSYTDTQGNPAASNSTLPLSFFRSGFGSLANPSAVSTTGDDVLNGNLGVVTGTAINYDTGSNQGNDRFLINTDVRNYSANIIISGFANGDDLTFVTNGAATTLTTLDGIYSVRDNLTDITLIANVAGSVQRIKLAGLSNDRATVGGSIDNMTELSTFLGNNAIVPIASAGTAGVGTVSSPATNQSLGNDILDANQRTVTGLAKVFDAAQGNDQYVIKTNVSLYPANIQIKGFSNGDQLLFDVTDTSLGLSQLDSLYSVSDNKTNITLTANTAGSVQSITLIGLTNSRDALGGSIDSITELSTFLGAGAIDLM
jgi:hypothetical protein